MRVASLGSGSKGNATLVDTGETLILIDCGLPRKEVEARLAVRGVSATDIDAILITHEHGDHCSGVVSLSSAHKLPVFLTSGTACSAKLDGLRHGVIIRPGDRFDVGDCHIAAEPVPHDAREPVQFCLWSGSLKLGVLTDLGSITPHVVHAFSGCDALILEFNHDPVKLAEGSYPRSVKARVGGDYGHLANVQARAFLDYADTTRLKMLFVAHISQQNNAPDLADAALADWPGLNNCHVVHATQEGGFDWVDLAAGALGPITRVSAQAS
ncbi:MAG: MBL fold metallo-hydrolase [Luminiphilus sp.]